MNSYNEFGTIKGSTEQVGKKRGVGCNSSNSNLKLEFNNVSALIENTGLLFLNRTSKEGAYEIPKGSGISSIYSSSLWFGGVNEKNQLQIAAQKFRNPGDDFWSGPLSISNAQLNNYQPNMPQDSYEARSFGDVSIAPEDCKSFDKFFTIRRTEVIDFIKWINCKKINQNCLSPSNEILNRIYTWPAHGDVTKGQDYYLAPFKDVDNDGIYNPLSGDYPWYDDLGGINDVSCTNDRRVTLYGDETNWWVFNDVGGAHTESGGLPIGLEIRAQAFSFKSDTDEDLNNSTFYNYEVINRSSNTLNNAFIGQFTDPDLGNLADDFVGCDVSRGLGYCYNGDYFDEDTNNLKGYGWNPPAIGIDFFEGVYQDADGLDNPGPVMDSITGKFKIPTLIDAIQNNGIVYAGLGTGFGDGVVDNERLGMQYFTYFTGGGIAEQSDPLNAYQFYNYMNGKWRFGERMVYGGSGFPNSKGATTTFSDYMFPGDSDPLNWSTSGTDLGVSNWSEISNNNKPGDRRFVQSVGPFTFKPGAVNSFTIGVVWARSNESDRSVEVLKKADTKIQDFFNSCFEIYDGKKFRNDDDLKKLSVSKNDEKYSFNVYPNPTSEYINIKLPKDDNYTVLIFDESGKNVYEETIKTDYKINVINFKEGVYDLILYNKNSKLNKKISIVH